MALTTTTSPPPPGRLAVQCLVSAVVGGDLVSVVHGV